MIIVNTHEAKTNLSQLLSKIEKKHEIVRICRNGKPIAEIVPITERHDPLRINKTLCKVKIKYDPTLPMSEDEWPEDAK